MENALNWAFNEPKFFKIFDQISRNSFQVNVVTVGMSTCTYVISLVPNICHRSTRMLQKLQLFILGFNKLCILNIVDIETVTFIILPIFYLW